MDFRSDISKNLKIEGVTEEEIYAALTVPPDTAMGDYALPCFKFAKLFRKSPVQIAEELKNSYVCDSIITEVNAVNGYLN